MRRGVTGLESAVHSYLGAEAQNLALDELAQGERERAAEARGPLAQRQAMVVFAQFDRAEEL